MLRKRFKKILIGLSVFYILVILFLIALIFYPKLNNNLDQNIKTEGFEEKPLIDGDYEGINFTSDPLSLSSYMKVDVAVSPGRIILSNNCTGLVITTTVSKTFSIQRGVEKKAEFRPNEHDILADVIENFDINVMYAKIRSFDNDLYYANLYLKNGDEVINLDIKPSDAVAIASRFKSSIYVMKDLLEKSGQNVC